MDWAYVWYANNPLMNPIFDKNSATLEMPLCDQEEADTRFIVHIVDGLNKGLQTTL